MKVEVVGRATKDANCGELGDLVIGGAGWWYMFREFWELSVESYDLRPSKRPAILFSHEHRNRLCLRVIPRALCPIGKRFFRLGITGSQ